MRDDLKALVRVTLDSAQTLNDLLPLCRQAIAENRFPAPLLAVDALLMKASRAHEREWLDFSRQLHACEEYLRCVAWLGRNAHFEQQTSQTLDPVSNERRRQTILWLIENYPESMIHQRVEATLNWPGDEAAYDIGRSTWQKKSLESPANVEILSNAASFLAVRDPRLAEQFLMTCVELEPANEMWQRQLTRLRESKSDGG